ncbi:MAG: type I restriction endonuclease subunit R [Candidatus Riflebacteria bacterium]|nr:type I restriction endonuclease subunit R [Candidatus Riflebacteria bacterium]
MMSNKTPEHIRLDERNHVEKPLLDQLKDLGWEIIDLTDKPQKPADTFRESFTEVIMTPILSESLKKINPWMETDQIEDVVKQLTTGILGSGLIENNKFILQLLLENTSVSQNHQTGEKSPVVRFIDFKNSGSNRFIAVCQYKTRVLGTERHIIPDIVLFVNGIPLVLIECKSPKVRDAIPEAIEQMLCYSEQRGAKGEGSVPLFYYNQFIVATCRQEAKFGTITTHGEKHFYRWSDPYPRILNELDHATGTPNDQQRLVAGMMDKNNLLDLIRSFTIFSTNDKGQTIKIVGRYQQFRAVKLAVKRLLEGKNPRERSGIIWHTQGSGKSLTMMFMVREMYKHPQLSDWKVVFVTDRTQLERQLNETSCNIGFTVKKADSIRKLKEMLSANTSDLVMAMIHKFREAELTETFPELNASNNILIMTDEAHRSQYKLLGANLDKALPNAAKIGYTGTPIDKTERVFGDYIDKYTMRQAIDDGVTLVIVYEGRTHKAEVSDQSGMDNAFEDVFSDYNLQERLKILGYGTREAYLEAEPTIQAKAKDMVTHYLTHVFPNGFKAQIVATSREAAVRYKKYVDAELAVRISELEKNNPNALDLDQLRKMQTDVIISHAHNDLPHLNTFSDETKHNRSIQSFKMAFGVRENGVTGDMGILIVNNMLLTGFDAPVEQVMYLDKIITNHNLLQAIARVNRVSGDDKDKGFVVDYVGVGKRLKKAIDSYDEREQKDIIDALSFPDKEIHDLEASHSEIIALLNKNGLSDLTDHDAFYDVFYDEDIRFEYMETFRKFTRCMNLLFPAKEALKFMNDYKALAEINALIEKHFHDERLSMKGIPPKLRSITDKYLQSKGIDQKIKPISILDEDFEKNVNKHKRSKTKAAEVEHAVRHHLDVELNDDPDLQASFSEALTKILKDFQNNWDKIYKELEKLRERIKTAQNEETYGLHKKKQMPFFRCFKREIFAEGLEIDEYAVAETATIYGVDEEERVSILVALTKEIFLIVERELKLTGFWESIPARNKLKSEIQRTLLQKEYIKLPNVVQNRAQIISRVMEIAEKNNDLILFAR